MFFHIKHEKTVITRQICLSCSTWDQLRWTYNFIFEIYFFHIHVTCTVVQIEQILRLLFIFFLYLFYLLTTFNSFHLYSKRMTSNIYKHFSVDNWKKEIKHKKKSKWWMLCKCLCSLSVLIIVLTILQKKIHLLEQVCECCEDDLHRLKPKIVNSNLVKLITGLFSGQPNYTSRMYEKNVKKFS